MSEITQESVISAQGDGEGETVQPDRKGGRAQMVKGAGTHKKRKRKSGIAAVERDAARLAELWRSVGEEDVAYQELAERLLDKPEFDSVLASMEPSFGQNFQSFCSDLRWRGMNVEVSAVEGTGRNLRLRTTLVAIPLSGNRPDVSKLAGNQESLTEISSILSRTGMTAANSVIVIGGYMDAKTAGSIGPGTLRALAKGFMDVSVGAQERQKAGDDEKEKKLSEYMAQIGIFRPSAVAEKEGMEVYVEGIVVGGRTLVVWEGEDEVFDFIDDYMTAHIREIAYDMENGDFHDLAGDEDEDSLDHALDHDGEDIGDSEGDDFSPLIQEASRFSSEGSDDDVHTELDSWWEEMELFVGENMVSIQHPLAWDRCLAAIAYARLLHGFDLQYESHEEAHRENPDDVVIPADVVYWHVSDDSMKVSVALEKNGFLYGPITLPPQLTNGDLEGFVADIKTLGYEERTCQDMSDMPLRHRVHSYH